MIDKERILKISKDLGLSHIGSNLSVLPILEEVYGQKKPEDLVILDNAHAHLAHLIIEEEYLAGGHAFEVEPLIKEYGIHCDRKAGCDSSGGSLGHGIGIGIGRAIVNPNVKVYVIVSDGSMMEGSNWEALRIANSLHLENIVIYCNFNKYTAVTAMSSEDRVILESRMLSFYPHIEFRHTYNGNGFDGVQGHYKKL